MINVLIIGSDSILGSNLVTYLYRNNKFRIFSTTRKKEKVDSKTFFLDLNDHRASIIPNNIDFAIIFSYFGGISFIRENPENSYKINVTSTLEIIEKLHERKIHIIYPSTNLILKKNNPTLDMEKSVHLDYVAQKLKIEEKILSLGSFGTVIRSSKIIHKKFNLFRLWIEDFLKNKSIHAFGDLIISPVWIDCYLNLIIKIISNKIDGKILITSKDQITYYDAALKICECIGLNKNLVVKVDSASILHKDDLYEGEYLMNCNKNSYMAEFLFDSNYAIQNYLRSNSYLNSSLVKK